MRQLTEERPPYIFIAAAPRKPDAAPTTFLIAKEIFSGFQRLR